MTGRHTRQPVWLTRLRAPFATTSDRELPTFDQDPNGTTSEPACGTDADGDGWFRVSTTVQGIEDGTAGHTGIVNDNIASPSVIQVRNLTIGGTAVLLAPAPTSKDECKHGGWEAGGFKNQGACIAAALH